MNVDTSFKSNAPNSTKPAPGQNESGVSVGDDHPFDLMLAVVQSGFGQQVSVAANGLHHDADLGETEDAHRSRLQDMSDRADARQFGGPRSRLSADQSSGGLGAGARSERLALQAQELGHRQEPTSERRDSNEQKIQDARNPKPSPTRDGTARAIIESNRTASSKDSQGHSLDSNHKASLEDAKVTGSVKHSEQFNSRPNAPSPTETFIRSNVPAGVTASANLEHGVRTTNSTSTAKPMIAEIGRASAVVDQPSHGRDAGQSNLGSSTGKQTSDGRGGPTATKNGSTDHEPRFQKSEFDRLVRTIRAQIRPGQSRARLHLRPAELGRLQIDTRLDGDRLEVLVQAQTRVAKDLLNSRSAELKAALEQHGLRMDKLEVVLSGQGTSESSSFATGGHQEETGLAHHSGADQNHRRHAQQPNDPPIDQTQTRSTDEEPDELALVAAVETRLDLQA